MFVFPCSLVLWRTWQFPRYALISLLKNHFKISFVQTSDDFNTPDVIKDMEGGATILTATVEWNKKTPHPWKLKISGCKIDFCCIPYKISSHKLIELSWCPPLPPPPGRQIFGVMERPVKLTFECGSNPLIHTETYRKASNPNLVGG